MDGTRISDLPSASTFTGAELVPVTQGGVTVKATSTQFKTTNAGDLTSGTVANARLPLSSTSNTGIIQIGTTAGTACDGADSRLSNSRTPSGSAGGSLTGTYPNPTIAASGVTSGSYGSSSSVPVITVGSDGRVSDVSTVPISGSAGGTVTSITAGAGLSGGTIIDAGTISLSDITTAQSNVGDSTNVPVITINAKGQVTALSTAAISAGVALTTSAPADLASSAVVGIAATAARADHQHAIPRVISANDSSAGLLVTQTGSGNAIAVEDEANPDGTPFVVTATGSVGIGTASPSVKLDVIGVSKATSFAETAVTATINSTYTVSLANGTVFVLTLTSATASTITLPSASSGQCFTLFIKQPASGTVTTAAFTATPSIKWAGGTAPTITATLGKTDVISFVCDGTNWFGSFIQNF